MHNSKMPEGIYDLVIIGGGPAGLAAGIYASRARMNVIMLESLSVMGQAMMTDTIENYPGVEKASGYDMISTFKKQAEKFGLLIKSATVKDLSEFKENGLDIFNVSTDNGVYRALSVITASGASPKKLGVPGESEFIGKGVSYCATCDAAFFRGKDILVVGGGDTAVEEALFLTKFARKVTLIHRRDRLRASKILQERIMGSDKVSFIWDSVIEKIEGDEKVEKVTLKNVVSGVISEVRSDGVFVFAGWQPNTGFLKDMVEMDDHACVKVDPAMRTSRAGIFAAGDCCSKALHQVVTAAGDGATASFSAQKYVDALKGEEYL